MSTRSTTPLIAAAILLLPILYVGSYLVLVKQGPRVPGAFSGIVPYRGCYRCQTEWADRVFWPLEQIDRKLRPVAWKHHDSIIVPPLPPTLNGRRLSDIKPYRDSVD